MIRNALVVLAAAAAVASLGASPAQAATVTINPFFGCPAGVRGVPAGSDITLRLGWATRNRGLAQMFEVAETTTLSIDGVARSDADDEGYRTLVEAPDGSWVSRWLYPTGITVGLGDSFTYVYDSLISHAVHDGITTESDHDQRPLRGGPGSVVGGPLTCTVVGV